MDGAAQMFTPLEENPIQYKTPNRQSRRQKGFEPAAVELQSKTDSYKNGRISKEIRGLLCKGGIGGKIHNSHDDWQFFSTTPVPKPRILDFLPSEVQGESDGELYVESVNENKKRNDEFSSTYQLVNLKSINDAVALQLCCKCNIDSSISTFINFCAGTHAMPKEKLLEIAQDWKIAHTEIIWEIITTTQTVAGTERMWNSSLQRLQVVWAPQK